MQVCRVARHLHFCGGGKGSDQGALSLRYDQLWDFHGCKRAQSMELLFRRRRYASAGSWTPSQGSSI
jgi:hypothetical protein